MSSEGFLERVAGDLWGRLGVEGLRRARLFLPSARSRLFFSQALAQRTQTPMWLPEFVDISAEMARIAGMRSVESLALMPELHRIFCTVLRSTEPLEEFYPWGEMLLRDFDQIDKYRVDSGQLFRNLADLHALDTRVEDLTDEQRAVLEALFETFSAGAGERQELRARYLRLWHALGPIYEALGEAMLARGEAYEGWVFRSAVARLEAEGGGLLCPSEPETPLVFVGFNALNACEIALFEAAQKTGNALFYWSYARYFVEDAGEEAGLFMRRNLKRFPDALEGAGSEDARDSQRLRIVSAPSMLSQVYAARDELEAQREENPHLHRTALVLTDESLLLPMLQEIPEWVEGCNVTMGYPLRSTLIYTFLESAIGWLKTFDKEQKECARGALLGFLQHPYSHVLEGAEPLSDDTASRVEERVGFGEFAGLGWGAEVSRAVAADDYCGALMGLLERLMEAMESNEEESAGGERALLLEYASRAYGQLQALGIALDEGQMVQSARLVELLLPEVFRGVKASFFGEPLDGLQLMGFLETRALDFDHIIVLSVNEQFLPVRAGGGSFILPSLGRAFGLPTPQQREAMYAYYFHTLLMRAQSVTLIYVDSPLLGAQGEPSRYVLQMQYDATRSDVEHVHYAFRPELPQCEPLEVAKEGWVWKILSRYIGEDCDERRTLSPKAINAYVECPLQFFFEYVAGVRPAEEEPGEEISALDFGNVVHRTLERLYGPFVGRVLQAADVKTMRGQVKAFVAEEFSRVRYDSDDFVAGERLRPVEQINREAIERVVGGVLGVEEQRLGEGVKLHGLEVPVGCELAIGGGAHVRLQGRVDRIDRVGGGAYSVIDYKTGTPDARFYTYRGCEALFAPNRPDRGYVLQVLLYCYMLWKEGAYAGCDFAPQLWFVRGGQDYKPVVVSSDGEPLGPEVAQDRAFEQALQEKVGQLFDRREPFVGVRDERVCAWCAYGELCGMGRS